MGHFLYPVLEMGQFFILRSRKFVNWNSPVFLKRYFFFFSTYTSNKCFFIIIRSTFPVRVTQNPSHHAQNHARKLTIFLLLPRSFLLSLSPSPSGTLRTRSRLRSLIYPRWRSKRSRLAPKYARPAP